LIDFFHASELTAKYESHVFVLYYNNEQNHFFKEFIENSR